MTPISNRHVAGKITGTLMLAASLLLGSVALADDHEAEDPDSLIAASHVIATHFQTVAAANDYWRE